MLEPEARVVIGVAFEHDQGFPQFLGSRHYCAHQLASDSLSLPGRVDCEGRQVRNVAVCSVRTFQQCPADHDVSVDLAICLSNQCQIRDELRGRPDPVNQAGYDRGSESGLHNGPHGFEVRIVFRANIHICSIAFQQGVGYIQGRSLRPRGSPSVSGVAPYQSHTKQNCYDSEPDHDVLHRTVQHVLSDSNADGQDGDSDPQNGDRPMPRLRRFFGKSWANSFVVACKTATRPTFWPNIFRSQLLQTPLPFATNP